MASSTKERILFKIRKSWFSLKTKMERYILAFFSVSLNTWSSVPNQSPEKQHVIPLLSYLTANAISGTDPKLSGGSHFEKKVVFYLFCFYYFNQKFLG